MVPPVDLLSNLSTGELEALAECQLVPEQQDRLSLLLDRCRESTATPAEESELDRLLQHVDSLTLLKTRARYTLTQLPSGVTGS
ncbi:MAG TPA: hypothetical protein VFG20_01200 [Planctomycetaceae bacterium]|jgi:hypothetical protein|nr:hypothetical protein [Planctomycetaceae bacterium]